jgi:hypothetical protein
MPVVTSNKALEGVVACGVDMIGDLTDTGFYLHVRLAAVLKPA